MQLLFKSSPFKSLDKIMVNPHQMQPLKNLISMFLYGVFSPGLNQVFLPELHFIRPDAFRFQQLSHSI
jgi:hypothetical protein